MINANLYANHPDFLKIKQFLSLQPKVSSYEIVSSPKNPQKLEVNIQGSLVLRPSDLKNGRLFFKVRKMTGNIYLKVGENMGRAFINKSVIPSYFSGDIIFERSTDTKDQDDGNLDNTEYLSGPMSSKKVLKKLEEAFSEIVNYQDIHKITVEDLKAMIKKIREEKDQIDEYKLSVDIRPVGEVGNKEVQFFINGSPLDLKAIEKAVYIMFILHRDGILLIPNGKLKKELQQIYSQISGRVQDDENGIMGGNFSESTLNSYRTKIRDAIKEHISNSNVVDKFAIEGKKGEHFKIEKATDDLRTEIKKHFVIN